MDEFVIQTEGLCKTFKDFWHRPKVKAVDNVSLSVNRGEVFGLLGPNGSGKSTTIKMILGLLFPTEGQVSVFGKPVSDVSAKKKIGFLPEESYLYKYLDAEETLDFYGRLFDLSGQERKYRIDSLLKLTGLLGAKNRLLGEYSKGMARRIGLAQALINDPELIILDEPTTGLDPIGTREIKDLIISLKEKGKTVLLCSHLLADVEDVCDRIVIMYGGKVKLSGRTDELLSSSSMKQITAEMDESTLSEVVSLLERTNKKEDIKVTPPTERLENFFLRVIEEAQSGDEYNDGAGASGGKLDFITEVDKDIISKLTAPEKTAEDAPVTSESKTADRQQSIISSLTQPDEEKVQTAPVPSEKTEIPQQSEEELTKNIKKDVINKLTRKQDG
ncbi:MAG: ABC transporter ATP-binding protein [Planctomycetota bacterium]|jgi:ABC-2 type transport system ATP-binding protein